MSTLAIVPLSVLFAAIAIPLNVKPLRRKWLSAPFLSHLSQNAANTLRYRESSIGSRNRRLGRRIICRKSGLGLTVGTALAGTEPREQAFVDGPVEELCKMLNPWENSHELADLPPEVWSFLKENRFFGMIIPTEYGGLGFSALAHRAVLQKIGSVCAVAGSTVAVPNSLGPAELLVHYGTDEQKNYYLPRLARGEEIPCFGLTGPTAGSDATSIPDTGIICQAQVQGKAGTGYSPEF